NRNRCRGPVARWMLRWEQAHCGQAEKRVSVDRVKVRGLEALALHLRSSPRRPSTYHHRRPSTLSSLYTFAHPRK
ncbi:hypothetical protein COCVIDRAFT_94470, partial [Bipolaris victoriae FI3]